MTKPRIPAGGRAPGGPYSLALRNDDTGEIVMDLAGIPEHVVEQLALLLGKLMPYARAAQAGVQAVRNMNVAVNGITGMINELAGVAPKRARGRK